MWGVVALLLTSVAGNATLYCFFTRAKNQLRRELNKPTPEPRVIVETRVVEKAVPVSVNHVESQGYGGSTYPGARPSGFCP